MSANDTQEQALQLPNGEITAAGKKAISDAKAKSPKPRKQLPVIKGLNEHPAFLDNILQCPAFETWDGLTGKPKMDAIRMLVAEEEFCHLRDVPPVVEVKTNARGYLTSWHGLSHSANLKWMLYSRHQAVALNAMTLTIDTFDLATSKPLAQSMAKTNSLMKDLAAENKIPRCIGEDHLGGVVEDYRYHPIERLLHGKVWDGVPRVQRVIDCMPVASQDEGLRNKLMLGAFIAAIAAIDDGYVSIKYCPVIQSQQNDFYKSTFIARIGSIIPGAFKSIGKFKPSDKTELRHALYGWLMEISEIAGMMAENDDEKKGFIGRDSDEFRQENDKHMTVKPRQTVHIATSNPPDYLKDITAATRFPCIALTAAIDIERVNQLLGWEFVDAKATLTKPELLQQFWLEVRHLRAQGHTHAMDEETYQQVMAVRNRFMNKGDYYDHILDAFNARSGANGMLLTPRYTNGEEFLTGELIYALNLPKNQNRILGRTLTMLEQDGHFASRIRDGRKLYRWLGAKQ